MAFRDTFKPATIPQFKIARALLWLCDRNHKKALLPPKAAIGSGKSALFPILLFSAEILFFAAHLALLILFYGVDVNTNAIKTRAGYRPPLETPRFSLSYALRRRPAALFGDCSRLKPCQACEPRRQWRRSCGDCLWLPIAERAPCGHRDPKSSEAASRVRVAPVRNASGRVLIAEVPSVPAAIGDLAAIKLDSLSLSDRSCCALLRFSGVAAQDWTAVAAVIRSPWRRGRRASAELPGRTHSRS